LRFEELISEKTIGRLSLYRRLLAGLMADNHQNICSHELAALSGGTASQVRRDLMAIGYSGSPAKGYQVADMAESIGRFMDNPDGSRAAIVGMGNLGRAIVKYFSGRNPKLSIVAAFDNDPNKIGRTVHGCFCHDIAEIAQVVAGLSIRLGVITVPAEAAQDIARLLVNAGITGILNFAPTHLHLGEDAYVEDIDLTMSMEKVAYFGQMGDSPDG